MKEYRTQLVHVESVEDIRKVVDTIKGDHKEILKQKLSAYNPESSMAVWGCGVD